MVGFVMVTKAPALRLGKLDHVARFRFGAAFEKSKLAIVTDEKAIEIVFAANFFNQSFSNIRVSSFVLFNLTLLNPIGPFSLELGGGPSGDPSIA